MTRPAKLVPLGTLLTRDAGFLPRQRCNADGGACKWSVLVDATVENRGATVVRPLAARAADRPRRR